MDLCCLGDFRTAPSYALRLAGVTVLLDCGLDTSPLSHFAPRSAVEVPVLKTPGSKELCSSAGQTADLSSTSGSSYVCPPVLDFFDPSSFDAVLLSNCSYLLALPYLVKNEKFRGRVLATQPTLQLGRLMMEELAQYAEGTGDNSPEMTTRLQHLPPEVQDAIRTGKFQHLYTMEEIADAVQRVELVSYGQAVDLFGLLEVTPHSSGSSLGSCNWLLQTPFDKFVYLSASSQLTTHPQALHQAALHNADVLLLSGLSLAPTFNPDNMLVAMCEAMASTLRADGNVLFPVFPTGVVYDILECLLSYMDNPGLHTVPIFFISPVADASLAFSNIFGEWASTNKQNKLYQPEPPFPHTELIKMGRLKFFPNIHDTAFNNAFRSPCVVLAGHPSLRLGDAVHFMKLWGGNRRNTVILTEAGYASPATLAPFQPLAMKALYNPIDTRLNFPQANRMLQELKPAQVVAADALLQPPPTMPQRSDLCLDKTAVKCTGLSDGEVITLPLQSVYQRAMLSLEVAGSLDFAECRPSVFAASLSACVMTENNQHQVVKPGDERPWQGLVAEVKKQATTSADGNAAADHSKMEVVEDTKPTSTSGKRAWANSIAIEPLREALARRGFHQQVFKTTPNGYLLTLLQDQHDIATVTLEDGATHVTNLDASSDAPLAVIHEALCEQIRMF
ncbi:integrator complex subunit 9-like [Sycon ciliatum]|uniref:integrator complex subunit 9-like n=1 Tax=Sycon ciliatum TaxID=27933 RepID=UPI0031F716ED